MLDERGVVGIGVLFAMIVCFASQDVGADLDDRVKDRHVAASRFFQSLRRDIDLCKRAWCALDRGNDRRHMGVLFRSRENASGVVAERLF